MLIILRIISFYQWIHFIPLFQQPYSAKQRTHLSILYLRSLKPYDRNVRSISQPIQRESSKFFSLYTGGKTLNYSKPYTSIDDSHLAKGASSYISCHIVSIYVFRIWARKEEERGVDFKRMVEQSSYLRSRARNFSMSRRPIIHLNFPPLSSRRKANMITQMVVSKLLLLIIITYILKPIKALQKFAMWALVNAGHPLTTYCLYSRKCSCYH